MPNNTSEFSKAGKGEQQEDDKFDLSHEVDKQNFQF